MAASPAPRTARLTSIPGSGSAWRAGPIGVSGEAATATATAMMPPATVTAAIRARDTATSLARVIPRARRIGYSAASRMSWRLSSWPMMASVIRPASAANSPSATAYGRMASSVEVTASDMLMSSIPPVW